MVCHSTDCMGNYEFESIAFFAKKRFVDGIDTIALLMLVGSEREKEEIALVSLLEVEDEKILDLQLSCRYADQCQVLDCRDRLRKKIEEELAKKIGS